MKSKLSKKIHSAVDEFISEIMRADILNKGKRIAGRSLTQVRPIETEVSVLKKKRRTKTI